MICHLVKELFVLFQPLPCRRIHLGREVIALRRSLEEGENSVLKTRLTVKNDLPDVRIVKQLLCIRRSYLLVADLYRTDKIPSALLLLIYVPCNNLVTFSSI